MKYIFYAYLSVVLVLSGCSSGKSTFERGNYFEAVITSVNRLRKNSDHKKSVETLRQAYPMAVAFFEDRAKTSMASAERFKWSEVVRSYTHINTMYDEIKRCPGALTVVPNPVNYFSKLQEARQNAAEEYYGAGILALQGKTRESAKQAYGYFKTANEYVAGYKEVDDYMRAALDAATVKIVVEPIPVHSKSVGVSAEFFNDKISEFVHAAPISEFVKFYSRAEAKKLKLNADHILQLQFDDFTVGEVYRHEKEIHLTKDSVVMGSYVSSSGNQNANTNTSNTGTGTKSTFTASGPAVVVTSPSNNTTQNGGGSNADQKAANDAEEKRRQEQLNAERALAEKLKAERDAAERERAAKEAAEKAAADQARMEKEQAEKERAEKARIENENAVREQAEKDRIAKVAEEKARAEREKAEKEKADREQAEKERMAKEAADKEKAEKDKEIKEKAEKDRADKEKAEKEKAEKEKADREKAEKEKAEKGKSSKAAVADPYINAADTTNVTDPVTICHMPPGNQMNARTLKINRSALKAHLGHGDMEGTCDEKNNIDKHGKDKPADDPKGKPANNQNAKPENNKGKPSGGASSYQDKGTYFATDERQSVLIASASDDPEAILRYFSFTASADTNKVYGTVKATLYHYTKTTTSKGIVSFRIIDAKTGALLSTAKMPGEFVWRSEWATFNGDERALSADQLKLSKQKEVPAPAPQELFIEFTRPIYDQITTKIKDFYKGY